MTSLYGYVTTRTYDGIFLPVPLQNLSLRDYASKRSLKYHLPRIEHHFPDSFIELYTLSREMLPESYLGMYTGLFLPTCAASINKIADTLFEKGCSLLLILENKSICNLPDLQRQVLDYRIRSVNSSDHQHAALRASFLATKCAH